MTTHAIPKVQAQPRERLGTRYAARLRREGRLPAVVYGHKQDPVAISLDYRAFTDLLHANTHLIELAMDASAAGPCLIKEVQWDHLGSKIVHVDLARVDLSDQVEVEVSVVLTGEARALQASGVMLTQPVTEITLSCRADAIPETLTHDITDLNVGEAVTVADLKLPAGVKAITDAETLIAQIEEGVEAEEEEVAAEAEPEVIGRAEEEAAEK